MSKPVSAAAIRTYLRTVAEERAEAETVRRHRIRREFGALGLTDVAQHRLAAIVEHYRPAPRKPRKGARTRSAK
jgi:hypothetical protein